MPEYPAAVKLFALSTVLELTVEPLWVIAETQLYVKLKVGTLQYPRAMATQ